MQTLSTRIRTALVHIPLLLGLTSGAAWADQHTFECTGEAYMVQDPVPDNATGFESQLYLIDEGTSPWSFDPIGGQNDFSYNALGYSETQNLLFAVKIDAAGSNAGIVSIDNTGTVSAPQVPTGAVPWPTDIGFQTGDVHNDTMYVSEGGQGTLYIIDLSAFPSLTFTSVAITGDSGITPDFAYWNGSLWGGDRVDGELAKIDPVTGVRTDFNVGGAGVPTGIAIGGAWVNDAGELKLYRNGGGIGGNGEIYEIDLTVFPYTSTKVQEGPASERNDAASCSAPQASKIRLDKTVDPALVPVDGGGFVTYTYEITNLSGVHLTLTSLGDDQLGDVIGSGSCLTLDLPPGGSATCTVSGVQILEPTTNTAVACAGDTQQNQSCDDDWAHVDVYGIEILKKPDSQLVPSGGDATFTIILENTGSTDLTGVTVTDPNATSCEIGPVDLAAGDTEFYDCTVSNVTAGFTNTATVNGDAGGNPVSDSDDALVGLCEGGPQPPDYEGCTPGFWKGSLSTWVATGLNPSDDFDTTFGVNFFSPDKTLEDTINLGGGGKRKLARHGTAGLLNALHPDVDYEFTAAEVIAIVQAEGDVNLLVTANERSGTCPAK